MENRNEATVNESNAQAAEEKKEASGAKVNGFEITYAVSNFICLLTVFVTTLFGVARLFSSVVNPVTAIFNIISLFSIRKGNVYNTLASVAATALYVAMLVFMVKGLVKSVKIFVKTVKKSGGEVKQGCYHTERWKNLYFLYDAARGSVYIAVTFAALCHVLSGGGITAGTYVVIVVFLINYVLNSTLLFIQENKASFKNGQTVADFIFHIVRISVVITCVCLAAEFLILPSGRDLAFGIRALFGSIGWSSAIVQTLYELIVKHSLDIALAFIFVFTLNLIFYDAGFFKSSNAATNRDIRSGARQLMIVAGISAAIGCILIIVGNVTVQFDTSLFKSLFYALKVQYLPILLFAATLYILPPLPSENTSASVLQKAA